MIDVVPITRELLDNSDIPYRLPENQMGKAAGFVMDGKLEGVAAFKNLNGRLIISAFLTEKLKEHPMSFHRVAVKTLKHLHEKYEKIYAPGKAVSEKWLLRLGFKPYEGGYIKCRQQLS